MRRRTNRKDSEGLRGIHAISRPVRFNQTRLKFPKRLTETKSFLFSSKKIKQQIKIKNDNRRAKRNVAAICVETTDTDDIACLETSSKHVYKLVYTSSHESTCTFRDIFIQTVELNTRGVTEG